MMVVVTPLMASASSAASRPMMISSLVADASLVNVTTCPFTLNV
jgi:hypothetical protein